MDWPASSAGLKVAQLAVQTECLLCAQYPALCVELERHVKDSFMWSPPESCAPLSFQSRLLFLLQIPPISSP